MLALSVIKVMFLSSICPPLLSYFLTDSELGQGGGPPEPILSPEVKCAPWVPAFVSATLTPRYPMTLVQLPPEANR